MFSHLPNIGERANYVPLNNSFIETTQPFVPSLPDREQIIALESLWRSLVSGHLLRVVLPRSGSNRPSAVSRAWIMQIEPNRFCIGRISFSSRADLAFPWPLLLETGETHQPIGFRCRCFVINNTSTTF